jgi:hypothetical protein
MSIPLLISHHKHTLPTYKNMASTVVTTTTRLVFAPNSQIEYVTIETIFAAEDGSEVKSKSTKEYVLEEINKYGIHNWYNRAGQLHRDCDLPQCYI